MCYFCSDIVTVRDVLTRIGQVIRWFSSAAIAPSLNLAVALRVIAHLSQSKDYNEALDADDMAKGTAIEVDMFREAMSYVKMYGVVADENAARRIYNDIVALFSAEHVPIDNVLGCVFLTIAEAVVLGFSDSPSNPFLPGEQGMESMRRLIEQNVMLFNAEKEFNREPGPDSDTRFDN